MAVGNNSQIEKRLWDAADQMRANSRLKSGEVDLRENRIPLEAEV